MLLQSLFGAPPSNDYLTAYLLVLEPTSIYLSHAKTVSYAQFAIHTRVKRTGERRIPASLHEFILLLQFPDEW
jgi:hypothetical protein